jgi:hypothetical protein
VTARSIPKRELAVECYGIAITLIDPKGRIPPKNEAKRLVTASLIEEFVSGGLTNFQFADRYPHSEDRAATRSSTGNTKIGFRKRR